MVLNIMVGCISFPSTSNDAKSDDNPQMQTTVREGCFVFQILQPTKIKIETLQILESDDLHSENHYDNLEEKNEIMKSKFKKNDLVSVDMIVTKSTPCKKHRARSKLENEIDEGFSSKQDENIFSEEESFETGDETDYADDEYEQEEDCSSSMDETDETNPCYGDYDASDVEEICSVGASSFMDRQSDNKADAAHFNRSIRKHRKTCTESYARLSDMTGWIQISKNDIQYCSQIPVESGIYGFYVDNAPNGLKTRYHPVDDSTELLPVEKMESNRLLKLEPMIKIYCDCKVTHPVTGVNFYRLQIANSFYFPQWVHDKQCSSEPSHQRPEIYKLLPCEKITETSNKRQQFAYQVLQGTVVRGRPDCTEEAKLIKLGYVVQKGDLIVGDLLRESPRPENGNGPFIRLTSTNPSEKNRLWLFEKKLHQNILKRIPVVYGLWEFQVVPAQWSNECQPIDDHVNFGAGIFVYKQPLDRCMSTNETTVAFLKVGDYIQCDCKLVQEAAGGDETAAEYELLNGSKMNNCYYRVILSDGNFGWVSDKVILGTKPARLQLLTSCQRDTIDGSFPDDECGSWSTEFVRGVAAAACDKSIKEIVYQPVGNVLVFQTADYVQINVFCSTKTVQTAFEHSVDTETDDVTIDHDNESNNLQAFKNVAMIYNCHRDCKTTKALFEIMKISVVEMMMMSLNMANNVKIETENKYAAFDNRCEYYHEEKKDDSGPLTTLNLDIRGIGYIGEMNCRRHACADVIPSSKRRRLYDELEIRLRLELLQSEQQILAAQAKRNELWYCIQAFDEERMFGKCLSKRRAKAMEYIISSSKAKTKALEIHCTSSRKVNEANHVIAEIVQPYSLCRTPREGCDDDMHDCDAGDDMTIGTKMDEGFEIVKTEVPQTEQEQTFEEDSITDNQTQIDSISTDPESTTGDDALPNSREIENLSSPQLLLSGDMPSCAALENVGETQLIEPNKVVEGDLDSTSEKTSESSVQFPVEKDMINVDQSRISNERDIIAANKAIQSTASPDSGEPAQPEPNDDAVEPAQQESNETKSDAELPIETFETSESTGVAEKENSDKDSSQVEKDQTEKDIGERRLQCVTHNSDLGNVDHQVITLCSSSNSTIITGLGTPRTRRALLASAKTPPSKACDFLSSSSSGLRRRGLVCGVCFKMFSGKYSRDIHCREAHKLFCRYCDKIFPSFEELKSHHC